MTTVDRPTRFLLGGATKNDLLELLRAIDERHPCKSTTEDLIQSLQWARNDVLAGLREARMRGLIVGTVRHLTSVELSDIALTPAARSHLGRSAAPKSTSSSAGDAARADGASGYLRVESPYGSRLVLVGELDGCMAHKLAAALDDSDDDVAVDLSGLTFVDSAGLRALLIARETHPRAQFVRPSTQVLRLLEVTGTAQHVLGLDDD